MTIEKIAFRDFIRGQRPADVLLLIDKKSNRNKGLYIAPKYADAVLDFIEKKENENRMMKKRALLDFVGAFGELENPEASHKEIKASKYE